VQRPLTSGPMGWPASQVLCWFGPRLHEKGKARAVWKVGGGRTTWLATTW
jgi:hypothetical protein